MTFYVALTFFMTSKVTVTLGLLIGPMVKHLTRHVTANIKATNEKQISEQSIPIDHSLFQSLLFYHAHFFKRHVENSAREL